MKDDYHHITIGSFCNKITGKCDCENGWYGNACEKVCDCNEKNTLMGNKCQQENGFCVCKNGFYGYKCLFKSELDLRVKPGGHFSWIRNDENFEEYGKLVYGKENKVLSILKSYGMLASIIETKVGWIWKASLEKVDHNMPDDILIIGK